jgi:hypothetical protein
VSVFLSSVERDNSIVCVACTVWQCIGRNAQGRRGCNPHLLPKDWIGVPSSKRETHGEIGRQVGSSASNESLWSALCGHERVIHSGHTEETMGTGNCRSHWLVRTVQVHASAESTCYLLHSTGDTQRGRGTRSVMGAVPGDIMSHSSLGPFVRVTRSLIPPYARYSM